MFTMKRLLTIAAAAALMLVSGSLMAEGQKHGPGYGYGPGYPYGTEEPVEEMDPADSEEQGHDGVGGKGGPDCDPPINAERKFGQYT